MLRDFRVRLALQLGITVGVLSVVALAIFFVGKDIKSTTAQVLLTRREISATIRQLSDLARLRDEARRAEPKFAVLRNALPRRDELFSFPENIYALAEQNDVAASFTFGNEEEDRIAFSLSANGTYDAVVRFIGVVEREYPFIDLSGFDIIRSEGGYLAQMQGNIFFVDETQE